MNGVGLPSTRQLAAVYEAGHAVAAVALRGAEAVEWAAILPSRKLAGVRTILPSSRYGATKLALAPIAVPRQHTLQAISDAVIALAGARALRRFSRTTRAHVAAHDRAIVRDVWIAVPGASSREERAFRHWLHVVADHSLVCYWSAVETVAKALVERSEVLGRQVASEVIAIQLAQAR